MSLLGLKNVAIRSVCKWLTLGKAKVTLRLKNETQEDALTVTSSSLCCVRKAFDSGPATMTSVHSPGRRPLHHAELYEGCIWDDSELAEPCWWALKQQDGVS